MASKGAAVHLYGDWNNKGFKDAQRDVDAFQKQALGFSGSIGKSFDGIGAKIGGAFAIGAVGASVLTFLKDSAAAAIVDEQSMVALSKAIENMGVAAQQPGVESMIRNLSLASGVADDELRPAYARLLRSTEDVTEAQGALDMALNISKATGKSMDTVANALGKAYDGNAASLGRLGLGLDKATLKSGDMNIIMGQLSDKFGGQWAAAADTYGGKLARVQIAADEAKETIGYSLLNAVDSLSMSFGGTGGAVGAITAAGDSLADFITGVSSGIKPIMDFTAALSGMSGGPEPGAFEGIIDVVKYIPIVGQLPMLYDQVATSGNEVNTQQAALTAAFVDGTTSINMINDAIKGNVGQMDAEAISAQVAATAVDELKAAQDRLNGAISDAQARLEFQRWLKDLPKDLDKNKTTFDGFGKSARENQDKLIEGFGLAEQATNRWAKKAKPDADEWSAAFAGKAKKVVDAFVADGFDLPQIREFLKSQGLWTKELQALFFPGKNQAAYAQADRLGRGVGRDLGAGIGAGIGASSAKVQAMTRQLIRDAEAAARSEAESQSPSKLFYRVGEDLGEGLKQGMAVVWQRMTGDINKGMDGLTVAIRGKGVTLSGELLKQFDVRAQAFQAVMTKQGEIIATARKALDDYAKSITSTVMGNIDFGTTNPDGTVMDAAAWVNSVIASVGSQGELVKAVATITGMVPEAVQQQLLNMAPAQGIAFANFIANPANAALVAKLTENYNGLATYTQSALGVPMANAFAMVGDESATKMIANAKRVIQREAADFQKWVKAHLNTEITVKVRYDTSDAPGRALGGPVTGSSPYIVGESGPELFVPWTNGNILPNGGSLPTASGSFGRTSTSGNTLQVIVQAGVSDPAGVGRTVVEAVRAYERQSGKVWASA